MTEGPTLLTHSLSDGGGDSCSDHVLVIAKESRGYTLASWFNCREVC